MGVGSSKEEEEEGRVASRGRRAGGAGWRRSGKDDVGSDGWEEKKGSGLAPLGGGEGKGVERGEEKRVGWGSAARGRRRRVGRHCSGKEEEDRGGPGRQRGREGDGREEEAWEEEDASGARVRGEAEDQGFCSVAKADK